MSEAEREHQPGERMPWEFTAWAENPGRAQTPEQKHALLDRLYAAWQQVPELRLGQLVFSATDGQDIFPIEDETLIQTIEEWADEREWDGIVSQPRLQEVGRRMRDEALRQYHAGETEEGGFDGL